MRSISIEFRIVISIVLFTILIVALERYQLSENIVEQFIESKKSKQTLLQETIAPVIALNLSLGLDEANKEYLDQIVQQNSDLASLKLMGSNNKSLYNHSKIPNLALNENNDNINFCTKEIIDPLTKESMGSVDLHFYDHQYQLVLEKNRETTFKIFAMTLTLLLIFVMYIRREFKHLKELSRNVLSYDPRANNFTMQQSNRGDEVGIIHNAIISMVNKINSHSKLLDELNRSLEAKVKERTKELESANLKLTELSLTDQLTDLSNRRDFVEQLKKTWNIAKRKNVEITLIVSDIDNFKMVNDTYGHHAGDIVIKNIANVLKTSLKRSTDFVARYGGEEFVIVLFATKEDNATKLCNSIKQKLEKLDHIIDNNIKIKPVTMSFGIATIIPDNDYSSDKLFNLADLALYRAKESGRNCIVQNVDGEMSIVK